MPAGDPVDMPNPFAVEPRRRGTSRHAFTSALKYLVLIAILLAVIVVVGTQSRRWLVYRFTSQWDTLETIQKQQRLVQLGDLGPIALPTLTRALADGDEEAARTAYEVLRIQQSSWSQLPRPQTQRRHRLLVESLEDVALQIPDDRTGWATALLQETVRASSGSDEASQRLHRDAEQTLRGFALTARPGPSVLSDEAFPTIVPERVVPRVEPLAYETDARLADRRLSEFAEETEVLDAATLPSVVPPATSAADESAEDTPMVLRSSSARLLPLPPGEQVVLRRIGESTSTDPHSQPSANEPATAEIRPVANLISSPLEAMTDRSVIHWLAAADPKLREQAKLELLRRGFSQREIEFAHRLASPQARARLDCIDLIARDQQLDPRPWLLMLLEDESREVRLRAISVLATMNDPAIRQQLRMHLVDQTDPVVAARLRRILDVR